MAAVNAEPASEEAGQHSAAIEAGQVAGQAFINPKTGKLGSPPAGFTPAAPSLSLQNKLSRSGEGLQARRLPNGTLLLDLQDRFQSMVVVSTTSSGEREMSCTDSASKLEHALGSGSCPAQTNDRGAP